MDRPWYSGGAEVQRKKRYGPFTGGAVALVILAWMALPAFAAHVPVRDGQTVTVKLRNVLTTDNCRKNDVIAFEVAEDVLVNGHVVIAKGAPAEGKVTDVKGAFKPRDKGAEVVFRFLTVRSADRQDLPLRLQSGTTRKGKDDEVHERTSIPGQITRVVGADKGKEYNVYIDGTFAVNTSDAIAVPPEVTPPAPAVSQPSAPVAPPPAPAAPASTLAGTDVSLAPSSVKFDSTPDGAEIVIDGTMVGNTPSILRLNPGRHSIEIHMAGYRTWSRVMVVDPESHPSVLATMIKQ